MAFNTKSIVKDVNQKPVPQYYNPSTDSYEVLQGLFGANKTALFDADGNAIDLAALVATVVSAVTGSSDTNTNKIDELKALVDGLETLILAIKDTDGIKKLATALPAGTNNIGKVNVATDERDLRGFAANKPAANTVPIGATYWSVDTDPHAAAVEVSNGTSWVVI